MTVPANIRSRSLLWSLLVVALLSVTLGDRFVTHWAYALERGRIQASEEELARLEDELPTLNAVSKAFKLVAKIARPGVVHIRVSGGELASGGPGEEELREHLRDVMPEEQIERWLRRVPPGSGSGIIIDPAGYILTNNHVVEGRQNVSVILHDERVYDAEIVGTDSKTDVAVLKIDAPDLHALKVGDSDALEVGDWVIAVGSPFGLTQTVTHGIVSATGRTRIDGVNIDYQDFIQTDAAINPGNSGGPLLNLRGEVVGVNTAIATHGEGVNTGVAFTIPSNMAMRIAEQLRAHGEVRRGWLGVTLEQVRDTDVDIFGLPEDRGVFVDRVLRRSPAERGGVLVEDVILAVDDIKVRDLDHLRAIIADLRPNQRVRLEVIRDGQRRELTVRLGRQPDSVTQADFAGSTVAREVRRLGLDLRTVRHGMLRAYDDETRGVAIYGIDERSGDVATDLSLFEVIVEVNGTRVTSVHDAEEALQDVPRRRKVQLTILEPTGDRRIVTIDPLQ